MASINSICSWFIFIIDSTMSHSSNNILCSTLDRILINGAPEEHITYFKTVLDNDSSITYPYVVPKDSYFLANDYRMNFSDSRTFGAVSKNQILGKVIGKLQSRNI